jgi:peptidoglycan/LPS O-acetylase OafA/YrhL
LQHFRSIDGLRAWLAWGVVFFHILLLTAMDVRFPILQGTLDVFAVYLVCVFIIISGFVVTHLLIEKQERLAPYLARRFLRIYPAYFVCLCLGIAATYLHFSAFGARPWGDFVPQPELMNAEIASLQSDGFAAHLLAHLTLLHGAISNQILPASQYMFLGPAWSLSLEWQFYLLAPLILFAVRSRRGKILIALATVAGYAAYRQGWFGRFYDASFLPGAGLYFAVGIATRLVFAQLPKFRTYPAAAMLIAGGFVLLSRDFLPFYFWLVFVAWLRLEQPQAGSNGALDRCFKTAFISPAARYLGVRSYSTYLIHEPVIHIIVYICIKRFALGMTPTFVVALLAAPVATLLAAILLYRYVEAPAINSGKKLFANRQSAVAPAVIP